VGKKTMTSRNEVIYYSGWSEPFWFEITVFLILHFVRGPNKGEI
jgi:hypothetical protein